MQKENKSENIMLQQLEDFKQQNPKVAEAMELFGITLTKYQETLQAMSSPQVYQSTSTARTDKPNR
jgi:DNA-directed RNA polymerase specialized sigma subunit